MPLICAGIAATAYGAGFTVRALRERDAAEPQPGHAFSLPVALAFALTLSAVLIASAALREWFGETGVIVAAAVAGFVDTHSAAIAIASLVASGKMSRCRRRLSHSRRALDQYDQQDHFRLEQRQAGRSRCA